MGAPGFDDAPFVTPPPGAIKPVQFVYPYYENPQFLARQLKLWATYPSELRDHLSVTVVDDGSPGKPAVDVVREHAGVPVRVFRIEVDIRWNWLAARNIGMHYASDGWCVLTDMDHMVPVATLMSLMLRQHDPDVIYRFSRRESTGEVIHPHPNSMFMTRAMFWKVGGYDEALSGFYGTDGDWRRRCAGTAPVRTLTDFLERHEYSSDSSTTKYLRKQPQDAGKKPLLAARKTTKGWRPKVLSFPHHEEVL